MQVIIPKNEIKKLDVTFNRCNNKNHKFVNGKLPVKLVEFNDFTIVQETMCGQTLKIFNARFLAESFCRDERYMLREERIKL